jgi:hypothetical protein
VYFAGYTEKASKAVLHRHIREQYSKFVNTQPQSQNDDNHDEAVGFALAFDGAVPIDGRFCSNCHWQMTLALFMEWIRWTEGQKGKKC